MNSQIVPDFISLLMEKQPQSLIDYCDVILDIQAKFDIHECDILDVIKKTKKELETNYD